MKEKEVGIMVKEKKEGGLELHLFPSKEAMARWRGGVVREPLRPGRPMPSKGEV